MKKVSEELRYDGATIEQVHEMLADETFREKVCDAQGVLRHTVKIEAAGEGMTVEIDQFQAAKGIPGFAKKFVGDEIHIVQSEDWTSQEKGNISLVIPGKPGEITGTALLTEDPDGTTETVNLNAKVNIPHGRRQDRGPDRRPDQQGTPRGEEGRPGLAGRRPLARTDRSAELLTHLAVDGLADQVGVAVVPGVLLDHVYDDPAQVEPLAGMAPTGL